VPDSPSGRFSVSKPSYPLVSVIIPYYKQERFVAETVRSAQQQTYPNFEIIVVDDGSPVPASSVLPESSDVLVLRTDHRGFPAATRNFGFKQSSGEYLVFLDSDDRLSPGALDEMERGASPLTVLPPGSGPRAKTSSPTISPNSFFG
jgi:glycosyltransferase involved in cell wall biosynthesis